MKSYRFIAKLSLYVIVFVLFGFGVKAYSSMPEYEWTNAVGGTGYSIPKDIIVDTNGNVYQTGYFLGTVDFGTGDDAGSRTSAVGVRSGYLTKYGSDGVRIWTKTFSGTGTTSSEHIDIDSSGNIYICGRFDGTGNFGEGGDAAERISTNSFNGFVSKYSSSGERLWTQVIITTDENKVDMYDVVINDTSFYLSGLFYGTVDFGAGEDAFSRTAAVMTAYTGKYNTNDGSRIWTKTYNINDIVTVPGYMAVDGLGNVLVSGRYYDGDHPTYISFISKYNSAGTELWTWTNTSGNARVWGISVDSNNNIYIAGEFWGTTDFGTGGDTESRTSAGSRDIFISKHLPDGSRSWTKTFGGTSFDMATGIDVFNNTIYLTGIFGGTVNFDPEGTYELTTNTTYDMNLFLASYTLDYSLNWVYAPAGGEETDGIVSEARGTSLYVLGSVYGGQSDFDPTETVDNFTGHSLWGSATLTKFLLPMPTATPTPIPSSTNTPTPTPTNIMRRSWNTSQPIDTPTPTEEPISITPITPTITVLPKTGTEIITITILNSNSTPYANSSITIDGKVYETDPNGKISTKLAAGNHVLGLIENGSDLTQNFSLSASDFTTGKTITINIGMSSNLLLYIIIGLILCVIIAGGVYYYKKRQK